MTLRIDTQAKEFAERQAKREKKTLSLWLEELVQREALEHQRLAQEKAMARQGRKEQV